MAGSFSPSLQLAFRATALIQMPFAFLDDFGYLAARRWALQELGLVGLAERAVDDAIRVPSATSGVASVVRAKVGLAPMVVRSAQQKGPPTTAARVAGLRCPVVAALGDEVAKTVGRSLNGLSPMADFYWAPALERCRLALGGGQSAAAGQIELVPSPLAGLPMTPILGVAMGAGAGEQTGAWGEQGVLKGSYKDAAAVAAAACKDAAHCAAGVCAVLLGGSRAASSALTTAPALGRASMVEAQESWRFLRQQTVFVRALANIKKCLPAGRCARGNVVRVAAGGGARQGGQEGGDSCGGVPGPRADVGGDDIFSDAARGRAAGGRCRGMRGKGLAAGHIHAGAGGGDELCHLLPHERSHYPGESRERPRLSEGRVDAAAGVTVGGAGRPGVAGGGRRRRFCHSAASRPRRDRPLGPPH